MNKHELKELLLTWAPKWRTRKANGIPEVLDSLNMLYPNVQLNTQIYCLLHDKSPYCVVCNIPLIDYRKATCSIECRSKSTDHCARVLKQKTTLREKYGVENIRHVPGAETKRKDTMVEKYGMLVSPRTIEKAKSRAPQLQKKGKATLLKKYGVENPGQLPDHRQKCITTMMNNHGVDHFTKIASYIDQASKTRLEKYIAACPETIQILGIHFPKTELQMKFDNPNYRIEFICHTCKTTDTIPTETFKFRLRSTGTCCYKCSGITHGSLKERELQKFIKEELGIDIKTNDRTLLDNKEIDIFVPHKNIAIEFDGLFWHNDELLDKNYHLQKTEAAKNNNIKLIHVFEDEWTHKQEIVKSRIKYILGLTDTTIYARTCEVRVVDTDEERSFLNDNHIQGYAPSSVKLGLYYKNKLISLMTFSKPNLSKGYHKEEGTWELLRFCSKIHVNVVGGAGKLFTHFTKNYDPKKILSFSDRRWGVGSVYPRLGFEYKGDTKPNYWYVDASKITRIHRFSLRKNKNDDVNLTEYQNRKKQGFLRIWDCGSSRWIWNKERA